MKMNRKINENLLQSFNTIFNYINEYKRIIWVETA